VHERLGHDFVPAVLYSSKYFRCAGYNYNIRGTSTNIVVVSVYERLGYDELWICLSTTRHTGALLRLVGEYNS
jgi:hypothetical protein